MYNMQLLDCTLRDGGYINDWKFGRDNIVSVFERQVSSNVDVIEVGFLDDRREFDVDRTIQPNTASYDEIFGNLNHGNAMVVAMIDYGTCAIENLSPCENSTLDGIRVIFKKEKMYKALDFCKQVKELGYKVFAQAVSITSYNDDELKELVSIVNDCQPYAMSMVDTYGLMDSVMLKHIYSIIDSCLNRDIILGFHAHNNFQLGYANAVAMLSSNLKRDILVDATLYGMGKSAGNAPIELVAMHMNTTYGKNYDVDQMQEAITTCLLDIYRVEPWGYKLFYYIAAANKCHPDYVSYLMNKRTLSVTSINEILQKIPYELKLGKDMDMIERLYIDYQNTQCNDENDLALLSEELRKREILVLGPGSSIRDEKDSIIEYINKNNPIVIAINYIPWDINIDYIFLTNSKRYLQIGTRLTQGTNNNIPIIATSNLTKTGGRFNYIINYSSIIDTKAEFQDNSMVMLIKLLMKLNVSKIALAGFDGYTPDTVNYFDINMEYSFVKEKADSLNQYANNFLRECKNIIDINLITKSHYKDLGGI